MLPALQNGQGRQGDVSFNSGAFASEQVKEIPPKQTTYDQVVEGRLGDKEERVA